MVASKAVRDSDNVQQVARRNLALTTGGAGNGPLDALLAHINTALAMQRGCNNYGDVCGRGGQQ
eukprot:NODE_12121_length_266_cov_344.644550.p1 GENE.NODE_12121_length_266_cov_344.644550~~NODE_12121_length_266_cov_344.644550.p1  ORF type:complete len:74 (-),score=0.11 NODE_12121_length_266_cov_344.644550:44-235(-)